MGVDLVTKSYLRKKFIGDKISLKDVIYKPIMITQYEVSDSRFYSSPMLTLQIVIDDKERVLFTQSRVLRKTIEKNKDKPPYYTKIIKRKNGCLYFAKLTDKEKELFNVKIFEL